MGGLGVLSGQEGQSGDRVLDAHEPGGLSDAAPLGQVPQDGQGLVVRELGVEQGCGLELGESGLTSLAVGEAMPGLAEVIDDEEIAEVALPVGVAFGVLAAEA